MTTQMTTQMTTTADYPTEQKRTMQPLVHYFDSQATHTVAPGEMVHDYYGVPVWLMKEYLVRLGATAVDDGSFEKGECRMQVAPAVRKRIGSLEIGGATVEFTGVAGAIQAVLSELEWKTLRA